MADSTVHCLYCGGTVSADHPVCPVCQAIARFVTCPKCGAKNPAGSDTCTCGASLGSARASSAPPCPRCAGRVLVLRRMSDGKSTALQCEGCHGCFVRVRDFSLVVDDSMAGHPVDTKDFVVPASGSLPPDKLVETTRCPACRKEMDRFHFGVRSPAVVDVCDAHGMWLDAGELAQVVAFAADVAKGEQLPPESAADQQKDAELETRLRAEETDVDRNAEIARANFRAGDPFYRLSEDWGGMVKSFTSFLGKRR
jgi:Zn-finger nucleic acid-binding protein/DNA-directed RNA polymerase subunit RPC12/RpoP